MHNDIKSRLGYFIPFAAVIGFFTALFLGEYLLSVFIAIAGILVWFIYGGNGIITALKFRKSHNIFLVYSFQ